jgi:predicted site-specific integrase-resolvase
MAELETYIPLPQAAVRFGLAERALRRMVDNGIIRAIKLPDGEVAVSQAEANEALSREEEAERIAVELRARYRHLRGNQIGVREAGRTYDIPSRTLSRWAHRGIIRILGRGRNRSLLLDEADVAYAVEVYRTRQSNGPTSRVFDVDGRPYVLKHPELAQKRKGEKA